MAVDSTICEIQFNTILQDVPLNCDFKTYSADHVHVFYGVDFALEALQGADYTVVLADDFEGFVITPKVTLTIKIAQAIAASPLVALDSLIVRRTVPDTTDFQETDAFLRRKISIEFDLVAMRLQQIVRDISNSQSDLANTLLQTQALRNQAAASAAAAAQSAIEAAEAVEATLGQIADQATAEAGTSNGYYMSPLRTKQLGDKYYQRVGVHDLYSSAYTQDVAGLIAMDAAAIEPGTPVNTRSWKGKTIKIDSTMTFATGAAPRVPVEFMNNGMFVRGGGGITFFAPMKAPRTQIFSGYSGYPTQNLSFYRGQEILPEWFDTPANIAANALSAINNALGNSNYSTIKLDKQNYKLGGAGTNIVIPYINTRIEGGGEILTNLELTNGAVGSGIQTMGTQASPQRRVEIANMSVSRSVSGSGIGGVGYSLVWSPAAKLSRLQSIDLLIGFAFFRSGSCLVEDCLAHFAGNGNGFVGFDWNGTGVTPNSGSLGNASSNFRDCSAARDAGSTGTGSIGFHIYGGYTGDVVCDNFSTLFMSVGVAIDFTTNIVYQNANADLIFNRTILDGFDVAGFLIQGHNDNIGMVTLNGGWMDARAGASNAVGVYGMNTRGVEVIGMQYGIGGYAATGARFDNSYDINLIGGQYVNQFRGVIFNGTTDSQILGGRFYNPQPVASNPPLSATPSNSILIVLQGACKRISVKDIVIGEGCYANNVVSIGPSCVDCEIELGPIDLTNIAVAISNSGTRSRIKIKGPASTQMLQDVGSDTYLWCETTGYNMIVGAGGGTPGYTIQDARFICEGKLVTVTGSILVTNVTGVSGTMNVTMPFTADGTSTGSAINATTGKQLEIDIGGGTNLARIRVPANDTFPATASQTVAFIFQYRRA